MIDAMSRRLRRRSDGDALAIRRDATALVGMLAGAGAKARWRRGAPGRPDLVIVVVDARDDAKLVAAALHRGWRSTHPKASELDFATAGGREAPTAEPGIDALIRATVPLDPERR